jgi:hypothetical protein
MATPQAIKIKLDDVLNNVKDLKGSMPLYRLAPDYF